MIRSSLFFENTSAQMIKMPSVWHPRASSSVLQPCRDTRRNPCDYKSNIRFHSFSCYYFPFKLRIRTNTTISFYTIKKSIYFFYFYFPFLLFLLFFLICSSIDSVGMTHCSSNYVFIESFTP